MMSKTWYPVIDLEKCIGCMKCVKFCPNKVYEIKNDRPVVVNPEGCSHGCKGCQKKCPVGAIQHVGDVSTKDDSCSNPGCGCGSSCC